MRRPGIALAVLVLLSGAALATVFATFPETCDREFVQYRVTNGVLSLRNRPRAMGGAISKLSNGCRIFIGRARRDGWVYVIVDDGMAGWVEESDFEHRTERVEGRP